jgi:3-hydroxyisobutyrate dehydrogenase-like beta-hydroxyacid dehydrogenase
MYDVAFIGTGPAGSTAATLLTRAGQRVAVPARGASAALVRLLAARLSFAERINCCLSPARNRDILTGTLLSRRCLDTIRNH